MEGFSARREGERLPEGESFQLCGRYAKQIKAAGDAPAKSSPCHRGRARAVKQTPGLPASAAQSHSLEKPPGRLQIYSPGFHMTFTPNFPSGRQNNVSFRCQPAMEVTDLQTRNACPAAGYGVGCELVPSDVEALVQTAFISVANASFQNSIFAFFCSALNNCSFKRVKH